MNDEPPPLHGEEPTLSFPASGLTVARGDPGELPATELSAALEMPVEVVKLLRPIGEGGMAVVWAARQAALGRRVAVKVARRGDAIDQLRLLREARLTARLEHPNIVPIHDVFRDPEGNVHVIMKQLDGCRWGALMRDAARVELQFSAELLDWNLGVLEVVSKAVGFAHDHGIVHRDIKPSNVMIGRRGEVSLLDWGVAGSWALDARDLPHVEDAPVAGTLGYIAPEQLEGDVDAQGPWTDVFQLGATLYQLLAGSPPFADVEPSRARADPRGRPWRRLGAEAPEELVRLVEDALVPDVNERLLSADEFASRLERFRKHHGSSAIAADARRRLDSGKRDELALAEAEVGFRAALKVWAENPVALRGASDVALERIELALDQGAVERAKALLAACPNAPPDLETRVDAASEHQRAAASRVAAALKQVNVAYDAPRRRIVLAIYGPLWFSGWLLFAVAPPESPWPIALFLGGCFVLGVVLAAVQGAASFSSQAHRTNVLGGGVVLLVATVWAAISVRFDLPVAACYLGVMLAQVVAFGLVAVSYDRRAIIPAVTCLVGVGLSVVFPSGAPWFAVAMAGGVALVTVIENLRAGRQPVRRGDDPA